MWSKFWGVLYLAQNSMDSLIIKTDSTLSLQLVHFNDSVEKSQSQLQIIKWKLPVDSSTRKIGFQGVDSKMLIKSRNFSDSIKNKYNENRMLDSISNKLNKRLEFSGVAPNFSTKFGLTNPDIPNVAKGLGDIPDVDFKQFSKVSDGLAGIDKSTILEKTGSIAKVETPEEIKEVNGLTNDMNKYSQDLEKGISTDTDINSLSKSGEEKIMSLEQTKGIKAEIAKADELKKLNDIEASKVELVTKAREMAVNHFAGHENELKAAIEKLSEAKSKVKDPDQIVDLMKKRPRLSESKTFIERITPGLSLQFQGSSNFWLDMNPYLLYQLTSRFTIGAGWNDRFSYSFKKESFNKLERIYGYRGMVHFRMKEYLWLVAEAERMYVISSQNKNIAERTWVVTYFGGIKTDIRINDHLKTSIQLLYNVLDTNRESPYLGKVNSRIGLEYRFLSKRIERERHN